MTSLGDKLTRAFIKANPFRADPFLHRAESLLDRQTENDGYTPRMNLRQLRDRAYTLIDLMTNGTPEDKETLKIAVVLHQMLARKTWDVTPESLREELAVYPEAAKPLLNAVLDAFDKPFKPAEATPHAELQAILHVIDLEVAMRGITKEGHKISRGQLEQSLLEKTAQVATLKPLIDLRLFGLTRMTGEHYSNLAVEKKSRQTASAMPTIDGLRRLYDPGKPYHEGTLKLDRTHTMAYQEFGNPEGIPIVYLHGGPGSGSADFFHQLYDPKAFRIVIYDQRGCGKSTPHAETKNNNPDLLVADLDRLRDHLGIDKWHVSGGSWGATLALLYAEEHPDRVCSLTLRGIWLNRASEIDWFVNKMGSFIPEAFDAFKSHIPAGEQHNLLRAYHKRLMDPDPAVHMPAARKWTQLENSGLYLNPADGAGRNADDADILACARIEAHFFLKERFKNDNRILDNIEKIQHIPTTIIQGMYDLICPPATAHELKAALPGAEFKLLLAGHATRQPVITDAIMRAGDHIRQTGSPLTPPLEKKLRPLTYPR